MTTCEATTTVDGMMIECEHESGHNGKHEGHVPDEDKPGLLWEKVGWSK